VGTSEALLSSRRGPVVRTKAERDRMILSNLGLVGHIAKRIRLELPFEDKVQEGTLGLIQAVERFDDKRGVKFGTYASWWVRQAIERMARRYQRGPQRPVQVDLALRKMKRIRRHLWNVLKRPPTVEEIAALCGLKENKARLFNSLVTPPVAVEDTCPYLMQHAVAPWRSFEWLPEDFVAKGELKVLIGELLASLKTNERYVVARRMGLDGEPTTLSQIALELGFSRERARQVWHTAMDKLRRFVRGECFEEFL
jgi:RNA polymerase primary sigma factor